MHGALVHSSMSSPQLSPRKPSTHAHVYWSAGTSEFPDSEHVDPYKHAFERHSSTSSPQFVPM